MKVAVVGTGHVGLPLALSLANKGVDVVGIDKDEKVRRSVNQNNKMPFHEPGYDEIIKEVSLKIYSRYDVIEDVDYVIITVGTSVKNYFDTDMSAVENVIDSAVPYLKKSQTIVLRSTLAPETTQYIHKMIESRTGLEVGEGIYLSYCPERIAEGRAKQELHNLPQIIGASDKTSRVQSQKLFDILGVESVTCSYKTAELSKIFNNASRYIYFAIANYLAIMAMEYGVDFYEIMEVANYKYPRGHNLKAGLTAGPCLRKDSGILNEGNWSGDMVTEAWKIHESMPRVLVEMTENHYGSIRDKEIGVLGYTFKKDTDDKRGSLVPKLLKYICRQIPSRVDVADPYLSREQIVDHNLIYFKNNFKDAMEGKDVVYIAINHEEYIQKRQHIAKIASSQKIKLVDIWNVIPENGMFIG